MATLSYTEVVNARTVVEGQDATYSVQFDTEWVRGKTWEFDPMSDAVNQTITKKTNFMRVRFNPVVNTMMFPEDVDREMEYKMTIGDARIFFKFLRDKSPALWFALDMANQAKKHNLVDLAK